MGSAAERVLVVTNIYPSAENPYFGSFVARRVDMLTALGLDVTVCANTDSTLHKHRPRKYAKLFASLFGVWRRLRRGPTPLAVEAHIAFPTGLMAWPVARALRAPLVLYAHGSDVNVIIPRSPLTRLLGRWVIRRSDLVVANSGQTAEAVTALVAGTAVDVVSPGIDVEALAAAARPEDQRDIELLFIGRLTHEKGAIMLVEAVGKLVASGRPVRVTVIGSGSAEAEMRRRAAALGVDLDVIGAVAPPDVPGYLGRARVLAAPSTGPEGLGLAVLEAMAAGVVPVATKVRGLSESIDDGVNGMLAEPSDPDDLARVITEAFALRSDVERRTAMLLAAEKTAAEHDSFAAAKASVETYREVRDRR